MIYIDLTGNPPPKKWLNRAQKWTQRLLNASNAAERKKVIDEHSQVWADLKPHLEGLSYGKCWFSEARDIYSYYHVEHFRPKLRCKDETGNESEGYWWLAFDWRNYRVCGSVGNSIKGDRFMVKKNRANNDNDDLDDEVIYLLDPTDHDDPQKITFTAEGLAKPLSTKCGEWDYERAEYTIKVIGLNDFDRLVKERKLKWKECADKITETQELMNKFNKNPSATTKSDIRSNTDWFRKKIAPCTELSATYKACLLNSSLGWAVRLVAENIDIKKHCKDYLPSS